MRGTWAGNVSGVAQDDLLLKLRAIDIPSYIVDDVLEDYMDRAEKGAPGTGEHLRSCMGSVDFAARARKIVCDVSLVSNLAKTISDTVEFKSLVKLVLGPERDTLLARVRGDLLREAFCRGLLDGLVSPDEKQRRIAIVMSALNIGGHEKGDRNA